MSLIELMISLVLGLMVVGSALAIFASNKQTYSATESLGRTQESIRLAFELMAREMREVGSTPCGNTRRSVGSVLNGAGTNWYDWSDSIVGYDGAVAMPGVTFGTAAGERIANTDGIELRTATKDGAKVISHDAATGEFTMADPQHGFVASDIVVVCDYVRGSVLQVTSVTPASGASDAVVAYAAGTPPPAPGNASIALGGCLEAECTPGAYTYQPNSTISRLSASRWFIGANDDGGRSLFLRTLRNVGGVVEDGTEEIVRGVRDMQVSYLLNTNPLFYQNRQVVPAASYVNSVGANDWNRVLTVRLDLQLVGPDQVGGNDVARELSYTVNLRNQNL